MTCKNCGNSLSENAKFCTICGAKVEAEAPAAQPAAQSEPAYTAPAQPTPAATEAGKLPEQYQPLSPWAYWGYMLLFSVPIVGFIFLIIFSCKSSNINRRNFARSYWCNLIIFGVALIVLIIIAILGGLGAATITPSVRF